MNQRTPDNDQWLLLVRDLWERLYMPFSQPSYLFFFTLSMAIGATGIWAAIVEAFVLQKPEVSVWTNPSVFKSIVTYCAALGSLSCIRVIVVEDKMKHLRTLFCLLLFLVFSCAVVAAMAEFQEPGGGYPYVFLCMALAIITWWLANWDRHSFSQVSPKQSMGGSLGNQLAGDARDYKT